jgi:hypothetical protein
MATIPAQWREFADTLVRLGDSKKKLQQELEEAGFAAFLPYQEFIESFAKTSAEVDVHRSYAEESAKVALGHFVGGEGLYHSPLIAELVDAARTSPLLSDPLTAWIPRIHLDPCVQNAMELKVRDNEEYQRRERVMLERREGRLRLEAQLHSTRLRDDYPSAMFTKGARFAFAVAVLQRELAPLGFAPARQDASKGLAIVRKPTWDGWETVWALRDVELFFFNFSSGKWLPIVAVEASRARSRTGDDLYAGVSGVVRYSALVEGFDTTYLSFQGLAELETAIVAHASLYRMLAIPVDEVCAQNDG